MDRDKVRAHRRRWALLRWFLRTDGETCNCGRGNSPDAHHWACRTNTLAYPAIDRREQPR